MSEQDKTKHDDKRKAVLAELKRHGIDHVDVPFDGGGDDGQIGDVEAFDSQDEEVDLSPLRSPCDPTKSLRDGLEEIALEALDEIGVDWCNDLGGEGTITIDAAAGVIRATVNQRVEEYETTEWEHTI